MLTTAFQTVPDEIVVALALLHPVNEQTLRVLVAGGVGAPQGAVAFTAAEDAAVLDHEGEVHLSPNKRGQLNCARFWA